ncbi:hypothetical protein BBJ28_00011725 [Nothophytophthora sp. Chile5]|nr:hypothetical protein BBJ28_00011725 [Nothophytophthora sp. Chile5]
MQRTPAHDGDSGRARLQPLSAPADGQDPPLFLSDAAPMTLGALDAGTKREFLVPGDLHLSTGLDEAPLELNVCGLDVHGSGGVGGQMDDLDMNFLSDLLQEVDCEAGAQINEQLRRALFLQSGFVRNLKSMFAQSVPCNIELNMRNFLHSPTHLRGDPQSRIQDLKAVCTDAKLDMAMQILLDETTNIQALTTPNFSLQQLDLGVQGFGMTTVAVYALETTNAYNTFKVACKAILSCGAVWPSYSLVTSSVKRAKLPPTKLNIHYGLAKHVYLSDTSGERVVVETRQVSYCRMTDKCGVFLWDYVDADDLHPLEKDTTSKCCTIGA